MKKRILEIGCGNHTFFHDFEPGQDHLIAIDDEKEMLEEAERSLKEFEKPGKIEFKHADATKPLGYPENHFDEVIIRDLFSATRLNTHYKGLTGEERDILTSKMDLLRATLNEKRLNETEEKMEGEWRKDLEKIVAQAHRLLKPGGKLIIMAQQGRYQYGKELRELARERIKQAVEKQKLVVKEELLDSTDIGKIEKMVGHQFRTQSLMLAYLLNQVPSEYPATADVQVFQK